MNGVANSKFVSDYDVGYYIFYCIVVYFMILINLYKEDVLMME